MRYFYFPEYVEMRSHGEPNPPKEYVMEKVKVYTPMGVYSVFFLFSYFLFLGNGAHYLSGTASQNYGAHYLS